MHRKMFTYTEAASESAAAALVRSMTIVKRKLSVCEWVGEQSKQINIDAGLATCLRSRV